MLEKGIYSCRIKIINSSIKVKDASERGICKGTLIRG